MKRRAVSANILWLLIIYIIPLLAISTYFVLGELQFDKFRIKKSKDIWLLTISWLKNIRNIKLLKNIFILKNSDVASALFKFCEKRQGGISGLKIKQIELLANAYKIIYKLIQDIKNAKSNIEMIFYIWLPGGMADEVAKSLINASKRGVYCRIILDSAGSINFFKSSWCKIMCKAGIKIIEALKVNILYIFIRRIDLRQHRKIIIIDNYIAYTGSMNLIDPRFFKKNIGVGEWVDLMVRIKGPIVSITLGIIFSFDWAMETGKLILPLPPVNDKFRYKSNKKEKNQYVQTIASGLGLPENMIHQALLTAIYSARKKLILTTPYFVPSEDLLLAICTASHRGVDVSLIIPRYNDSILVSWVSRAFFDELLEAGVKIYQFGNGLLHTKSLLVDDQLSMIGTLNFDMRSLWINFELVLFIDGNNFSNNLFCIQKDYISNSKLIDPKVWSRRDWKKKIFEKILYFISPLL